MKKRSILSMVLAYLVPGAGHFYLGYRRRAMVFFAIIVTLFVIGLSVDGGLYTVGGANRAVLRLLAAFGSLGAGAIYFIASAIGPHGNVNSLTYEYGTTFTLTAGLMNLLLVLDCFDIAEGKKKE
jgi:hypothetical protein